MRDNREAWATFGCGCGGALHRVVVENRRLWLARRLDNSRQSLFDILEGVQAIKGTLGRNTERGPAAIYPWLSYLSMPSVC